MTNVWYGMVHSGPKTLNGTFSYIGTISPICLSCLSVCKHVCTHCMYTCRYVCLCFWHLNAASVWLHKQTVSSPLNYLAAKMFVFHQLKTRSHWGTLLKPWGSPVRVVGGSRWGSRRSNPPGLLWQTHNERCEVTQMSDVECWPTAGGVWISPAPLEIWPAEQPLSLSNSINTSLCWFPGLDLGCSNRPGVPKVYPICIRITRRYKNQPWVQL